LQSALTLQTANTETKMKQFFLLLTAVIIVIVSHIFALRIASNVAEAEKQRIQIWAEATEELLNESYSDLAFNIVEQNNNIPIIIIDDNDSVITFRNITREDINPNLVADLKEKHEPIIIDLSDTEHQYIIYDDSFILKSLRVFPTIQFTLIIVFIILLLWILSAEKQSVQNKLWVGLSRETAHQLGTPISSLTAWLELLKSTAPGETIEEMNKDVMRLQTIANRFSKIGSTPKLEPTTLPTVVNNAVEYMRRRTSNSVQYSITDNTTNPIVHLSEPLIQWVIENLCKNAVDAMNGHGSISILIANQGKFIFIEVSDTGHGIDRRNFKRIFKPGFTTKKRGWGLGLSLAYRIINEYHHGSIYIKSSSATGTTFRIELPQQ